VKGSFALEIGIVSSVTGIFNPERVRIKQEVLKEII
jgi:hypothetical protein